MDFFIKLKDVFTKKIPDTSETGKINTVDVAKLTKTGILVGVSAALASILASLAPDTLGVYQPVIILVLTVTLDFVNKLIKNNK